MDLGRSRAEVAEEEVPFSNRGARDEVPGLLGGVKVEQLVQSAALLHLSEKIRIQCAVAGAIRSPGLDRDAAVPVQPAPLHRNAEVDVLEDGLRKGLAIPEVGRPLRPFSKSFEAGDFARLLRKWGGARMLAVVLWAEDHILRGFFRQLPDIILLHSVLDQVADVLVVEDETLLQSGARLTHAFLVHVVQELCSESPLLDALVGSQRQPGGSVVGLGGGSERRRLLVVELDHEEAVVHLLQLGVEYLLLGELCDLHSYLKL